MYKLLFSIFTTPNAVPILGPNIPDWDETYSQIQTEGSYE